MSHLSVAKKARPFEISLVNGYFLINFPSYAPQEIIQTCILYCFLLEGFDKNLHSQNITIQGLNNTICEFKQLSKTIAYSLGRNIFVKPNHKSNINTNIHKTITPGQYCRMIGLEFTGPSIVKTVSYNGETKRWKVTDTLDEDAKDIKAENLEVLDNYNPYDKNIHWRFEIQKLMGPNGGGIIFGLVENDEEFFEKRLKIATSLASSSVKSGDYVDLYLDLNERAIMFIRNGWDFMGTIKLKTTDVGYRFCIQFVESFGKIQFIEYHESSWYMHQLTNTKLKDEIFHINRNEAICHAGLALTRPLFEFNHFVIALSLFPNVQRWVDGLIFSIICGERTNYELSYESALRYQPQGKGGESVGYLAKIYYNQGIYDKALILLMLLQQKYVNENKLNDAIAMCLAVMGNKKESVKYCDLHTQNMKKLEQNVENEQIVADDGGKVAQENMYMDQIAFCYEDVDDTKAIEYYQNAVENSNKINTLEWIYARMGGLYTKLKEFERARTCYQKVIEMKPDNYLSYFNYAEFLRNFEKHQAELDEKESNNEEEEAGMYYKKALDIALKSVGGSDDEDVVLTIIDCYRMLRDFEMAIKYLKIYLMNYEADNVGIMMILKDCYIEVEDYDNAILCLDKLFNIDDNVFEYNFEYAELLRVYDKDQSKSNIYYKKAIEIGEKLLIDQENEENKDDNNISASIYEMLSICYENLENDIGAIKYYILHLHENKKDILTMNKLANAYFRQKDNKNAKKCFLQAMKIGENNTDKSKVIYLIYYDYAMFLEDLKCIKESKEFIQKSINYCAALKNQRTGKEAENIEKDITEYIHISSCYVQLKEYENVRKWLDCANKIIVHQQKKENNDQNKNNINFSGGFMDEFNLNCALCYLLSDKDYDSSLKYLLKIDDSIMKKCGLYAIASCIYRGFRDIENAFKCATIGVQHSSDINGIMTNSAYAILLNETGKYLEADKHFQIALNIDKEKKDFELIESYSESLEHYVKDYEKSLFYAKLLEKIACDDSEICRSFIRMATIYFHLNKKEKSNKYFNLSLSYMERITNNLEKEYIYQTFGYYYLITKQYKLSLKYLLNSYEIDPREPGITGLLAICLYEMKKEIESINYLQKSMNDVIEINDPFVGPKVIKYYSNILFKQNEYKKLLDLLLFLVKQNLIKINMDEIYYLISRCYSKLLQFEDALSYLHKANQINPTRKIYKNQIQIIEKIKVTDHEQYI